MSPSANGKMGAKKKGMTREARYKKTKAAEAASRAKLAPQATPATARSARAYDAKGKQKARQVEEDPHPFRYKSFNDRLASVHINIATSLGRSGTGALAGLDGHALAPRQNEAMSLDDEEDDDDDDDDVFDSASLHAKTSFGIALQAWRELNLSLPFTSLAQRIQPLSQSLPLLLHNQQTITNLLQDCLNASYSDSYLAYEPVLDLIPRLAADLGSAFLSSYRTLVTATLQTTMVNKLNCEGQEYTAATIVERSFESLAATFRCMAPFVLRETQSKEGEANDWLVITWESTRPYLGWTPTADAEEGSLTAGLNASHDEAALATVRANKPAKQRKVPTHTRRFTSEALAHLVRRAKLDQLQRISSVMMSDVRLALASATSRQSSMTPSVSFAAGVAGVWLEVTKSVDGRVHSNAADYLSAALTDDKMKADKSLSLARRIVGTLIVTALGHHASATNLTPVFGWIGERLRERVEAFQQNGDRLHEMRLNEVVEWTIAFVGVRKGKRVDDEVKSTLFALLVKVSEALHKVDSNVQTELRASMIQLLALALPVARIQDLIGPAAKVIEAQGASSTINEHGVSPTYASLVNSLARMEFSGFRQIVLPSVLKVTAAQLDGAEDKDDSSALPTLNLLCALDEDGVLDDVASLSSNAFATRWQTVLASTIQKRITTLTTNISQDGRAASDEELDCVALAGLLYGTAHASKIVKLLSDLLSATVSHESQQRTSDSLSNQSPALMALAMQSLTKLIARGNADLTKSLQDGLTAFSLDDLVIGFGHNCLFVIAFAALFATVKRRGSAVALVNIEALIETLGGAVSSHDERLRQAAVQILALAEQNNQANTGLFGKLLDIEARGLSVETLGERNVLQRDLARFLVRNKVASADEAGRPSYYDSAAKCVIRSIVSTMKLNLRPLWQQSRLALVDISAQYGQEVWAIAFEQLTLASDGETTDGMTEEQPHKSAKHDKTSVAEVLESALANSRVDKTFQDPLLVQRKQIVAEACLTESRENLVSAKLKREQEPHGRLDSINYQVQLLALFSSIATMAERNNAPLMEHFFRTIVEKPTDELEDEEEDEKEEPDEEAERDGTDAQDVDEISTLKASSRLTRNQRRDQLCAYLETFAKFANPKALFRSGDLHAYLYQLCAQGDKKVQKLALDVVLRWKDPAHVANAATMKTLLDTSQFREQLTLLILADESSESSIQTGHRASLMPLLLRLLFGIIISKQSRTSGQASRKTSILTALADLHVPELAIFIEIMLQPFDDVRDTRNAETGTFAFSQSPPSASRRVQVGFVNLLEDVVKHLGARIVSLWTPLLSTLLNITYHASLAANEGQGKATQTERSLRQSGMKRLNDFFRQPTNAFEWQPFMPSLFANLITPRLASLRTDSIQSPSAVLEMFHTWSTGLHSLFFLVDFDDQVLPNVLACLSTPGIKPIVANRILDIVEHVIEFAKSEEDEDKEETEANTKNGDDQTEQVEELIVRPYISSILRGMESLLGVHQLGDGRSVTHNEHAPTHRILQILAQIATYVRAPEDIASLVKSLGPLLRKSNNIISEKSKVDVLTVFEQLLPDWLRASPDKGAIAVLYESLSSLFSRIRSRLGRATLCRAFGHFVLYDYKLRQISLWIDDLNSFDAKRMQEVDFDRRLRTFDTINAMSATKEEDHLEPQQWSPLLYNFTYYVQDPDELAIRASAGTALRTFADIFSATQASGDMDKAEKLEKLFVQIVFAGLRRSLRSSSELVKREAAEVMGYCVSRLPQVSFMQEMQALLVEGDEEANFFNNIHHIQVHRRARSLARLGHEAKKGTFKGRTIAEIFLPIVEQFLRVDTNHGDGNLIEQAVLCLGALASQLAWGPYNVLLWRYLALAKKEKDEEKEVKVTDKVSVRAAMAILDNFHFNMDENLSTSSLPSTVDQKIEEVGEEDDEEDEQRQLQAIEIQRQEEAALAQSRKVLDAVRNRLLPKLMECLELKDELDDAVRLPIAVGVARVLLQLPQQHRQKEIVRLLNTLAHVFRSKAQETRDLARTTLAKVAMTLGPKYFVPLVVELRKVLTRGPQIAVLAFTVHNVLLHCMLEGSRSGGASESSKLNQLDKLDEGANVLMEVIVEDLFGRTAEDRQSIENRTTYREVKATKSLDTLEHVAKIVDSSRIRALLLPLKQLMHQTEAVQAVRMFDDCLRRIAAGLQVNPHIDSEEYLILCHGLLNTNSTFLQSTSQTQQQKQSKAMRKTNAVLAKRQDIEDLEGRRDHYARNAHRFVAFGLDLLASAMRKGKFDFDNLSVLAKLEPMVDAVGATLFAQQSSIIVNGLRCLTMLIRCPLRSVRKSSLTITKQTVKLIEREGNAQSDILMASLKLLTVVLRDRGQHDEQEDEAKPPLTDRQLQMLCRLIDFHLEESVEMQGTLFTLLRAIISRKPSVAELYDLMDKVARMIIVQQSDSVRAMARSAFLDFLLDMPQGKRRFDNQLSFFVKNFDYIYQSGRLSVLEFVNMMVDKISPDVLRPYVDLLFVGLVMRLANDDSATCREKAAKLIEQLIGICGENELGRLVALTQTWSNAQLDDRTGQSLARVAAMVYNIMVDAKVQLQTEGGEEGVQTWLVDASSQSIAILQACVEELEAREVDGNTDGDDLDGVDGQDDATALSDWQLTYHHLQLLSRLFKNRSSIWSSQSPEQRLSHFEPVWQLARRLLLYPHAWVRLVACRLIGERFGVSTVRAPTDERQLADEVDLCKKFSLILRSPQIDEALSLQVIKNLVFLGKCFAQAEQPAAKGDEEHDEESEKEDELWESQPLRWLFNRLSHQLRRSGTEKAYLSQGASVASEAILKWMAAMMSQMEPEGSRRYLIHVIAPIYRILEGNLSTSGGQKSGTATGTEVAGAARRASLETLAGEVQEVVQARVGTQSYAAVYANVKRKATDKRKARRAQEIQRSIDFPEQTLARKQQRNHRKHDSRKRKSNEHSMQKDRVKSFKRQK